MKAVEKGRMYFSKEELRELGTLTRDLAKAAIDSGDKAKAKELVDRMYGEFEGMHDTYNIWTTSLMSYIGRNCGDRVLEQAMREVFDLIVQGYRQDPLWQKMVQEGDFRAGVMRLALGLLGHLRPLTIEEDAEKIVIQMQPCGSGGRSIQMGWYEPPFNFLKVEKPQPLTYGQANMPVYCVHAAVMTMLAMEHDVLYWFEEPSDKLGEAPCKFYIYKDPDDVPSEVYAKLGKKKPGGGASASERKD